MKKLLVLAGMLCILLSVSSVAGAMDFGTITAHGLVLTPASVAGAAGLNLPAGTAPTSPNDGDIWTTTAGVYVRINGATIGPLTGGAGTITAVTGTGAISSTGGATPEISIADAVDDGSTKGAASFTAADFDATAGNIAIDYTNGQAAATAAKGFLTAADWNTFNGKQAAFSAYTLSEATSSVLTITNGEGAVVGAGDLTIAVKQASTSVSGYLSDTDWDTFNDKQVLITGAATTIDTEDLDTSRAVVSSAAGKIEVATTTATEIGYVNGVTSSIQDQLDATESYFITFTDGDLAAGVLTVEHDLGTQFCSVDVFNDSSKLCYPDDVTFSADTNCAVDLSSYGTISGTWGVRVAE